LCKFPGNCGLIFNDFRNWPRHIDSPVFDDFAVKMNWPVFCETLKYSGTLFSDWPVLIDWAIENGCNQNELSDFGFQVSETLLRISQRFFDWPKHIDCAVRK
jgi:hypothetical protein